MSSSNKSRRRVPISAYNSVHCVRLMGHRDKDREKLVVATVAANKIFFYQSLDHSSSDSFMKRRPYLQVMLSCSVQYRVVDCGQTVAIIILIWAAPRQTNCAVVRYGIPLDIDDNDKQRRH